jgi:hypothetical protein
MAIRDDEPMCQLISKFPKLLISHPLNWFFIGTLAQEQDANKRQ